jgi:hypothetical protein
MSNGAELLSQMLPPLTASCERLTISAILEPRYDVGGDGFDYAIDGPHAPASPEPAPPELLGYHTNFPGVFPPDVDAAIRTVGAQRSDLSAGEQRAIEQLVAEYKHASYAVQLGTLCLPRKASGQLRLRVRTPAGCRRVGRVGGLSAGRGGPGQ